MMELIFHINLWRRGVVLITTAQLHLTKPELIKPGSAQVQTLLAACPRFAMARISGNGPDRK